MKIKAIYVVILFTFVNFLINAQELELLTGPFYDSTNYRAPIQLSVDLKGTIPITHYQQCNQTWSSNSYGIGSCYTICVNGCAMTSGAMLLKANGVNVNPGQLNLWLQNNSGYSGCGVLWTAVDNYPGSTMAWYGSATYSLSVIKSEIDAGNPVIAHVDHNGPCKHFVVIYGYTGAGTNASNFLVADPATSSFPNNWSNYTICSETYALRLFHHVYTSCTNPSTPFCNSPGTLTNPGTTINTKTPTLSWSIVAGATDYDVFIRKDPLTSGPIIYQQNCVNGNTLIVPANTLINDGYYRWNVLANFNCGQCTSGYAVPLYFHVISNSGIEDLNAIVDFSIYPNPNQGEFYLELNVITPGFATIEIRNALGQLISTEELWLKVGKNKTNIKLEDVSKGIYFIKLNTSNTFITKLLLVN